MANPQKEHGHTQIANEILERVMKIKFNGTQFRIIMAIWRYTYGFNRKQYSISETFLQKYTDIPKRQIQRELTNLIKSNVILVVQEATFTTSRVLMFNKDYDTWNCLGESKCQQTTKMSPVDKKDYSPGDKKDTSTGDKLVTHIKKESKENIKEIYNAIIDLYHELCPSLPKIKTITDKRKRLIKARWKQNSNIEVYRELFSKAESSDFLSGRNGAWTSCNFDWLLNENNMVKVLEGNYDNKDIKTYKPKNKNGFHNFDQPMLNYTKEQLDQILFKKKTGGG